MKKLQPVLASVVLSLLLAVATFADGIIETGITTPPPSPPPSSTATTQSGSTTSTTTSPDPLTEAALALLQALLALLR